MLIKTNEVNKGNFTFSHRDETMYDRERTVGQSKTNSTLKLMFELFAFCIDTHLTTICYKTTGCLA